MWRLEALAGLLKWRAEEWWRRKREAVLVAIADRVPHELAKWIYIRVGVHATTGQYSDQLVPELTMLEALRRWG